MDDELWDVTDAAGIPTGRTHRRGDPDFPVGMFHIVSSVVVVRGDGLVLMTRRAAVKDWGLYWEFPAGSALTGETSAEAAVRELAEEAGVHVGTGELALVGRLVLAVVNFPPRQIGPMRSEVLTLGVPDAAGEVVLIAPDADVPVGGRLY